jgi:CheY-like chemotaxis protein
MMPESKGCLWFGLSGCATSHAIRDAENIARELSEWFEWYCPVVEASIRSFQERDAARRKVYEMVSVIHDARAPLGALKHLVSGTSWNEEGGESPERELEYLEKLLALCAPTEKGSPSSSCDVSKVVARVCGRYERQQLRGRISWPKGYDPVYGKVVDLDLERVVANILTNAARYAPRAQVNVSVKQEEKRVIISITDDGPGISPGVVEKLETGRGLPYGGASGWGIGLQTSRDKVLSVGGDLRIASCLGRGTEVSILLEALAGRSRIEPQTLLADSAVQEAESYQRSSIYLVDDDADHAESLARILGGAGLQAIAHSSLQSLLSQGSLPPHAIVLCDARMPDGGAEELLKILSKQTSSPTVAVMSGETGDESLYRFAALGAQAFFAKPIESGELATWIKNHQRR